MRPTPPPPQPTIADATGQGLAGLASASLQAPDGRRRPLPGPESVWLACSCPPPAQPFLPPALPTPSTPAATLIPCPPHRGRACGWLGRTHQKGPRGETPKGLRAGRGSRCQHPGPCPAPSRGAVLLSSEDGFRFCSSCPCPVLPLGLGAGSPPWERPSSGPRNSQA